MLETWVRSLGREDLLEEEMITYSCLENPMDRERSLAGYSTSGCKESDKAEHMSTPILQTRKGGYGPTPIIRIYPKGIWNNRNSIFKVRKPRCLHLDPLGPWRKIHYLPKTQFSDLWNGYNIGSPCCSWIIQHIWIESVINSNITGSFKTQGSLK